jgi:RNA polymerase sigma-70 factor (ECF subfamily)
MPEDVTVLLAELSQGRVEAGDKLVPLVYNELRRVARAQMQRERPGHTLQATALVHEAYLKLAGQRSTNWQNRAHFFGVAAQLMRRILIDHARGHNRGKRGGAQQFVPLDKAIAFCPEQSDELLRIDEALKRLSKLDVRQAKIVEMRFFAGLTSEEIAEVLNISAKTVKRDWAVAKAWLHGELSADHGDDT